MESIDNQAQSRTRARIRSALVVSLLALGASLAGCSATTLRCSSDGEGGSFVELINVPGDIGGSARHYTELCGFAYEEVANGNAT